MSTQFYSYGDNNLKFQSEIFLSNFESRASVESFLHDKIDFCIYILNVTSAKAEWMRSAPEYMQIKYSKSNFKFLSEIAALILKNFVKDLPNLLTESNIEMAHAAVECFKECLTTAATLYQRKLIEFLKVSRKYSLIDQIHCSSAKQ